MKTMNRKTHRNSFSVVLASLLLLRGVAHGQEPPSRPARIGDLELVAALNGDQPAGIAVTDSRRLFVTFPRHDGDVAFTLGEMKDGRPSAYPSAELNQAVVERPADALFSVQTLQVDASGHLWALDTGTLHFGQPPVKGAPKLVEIDLASNRVLRKIVFPREALASKTALKDFRLNFRLGQQGTVFITDSGPGCEALIVLDLASGHAKRRLADTRFVTARSGQPPIVGYVPLVEPSSAQAPKPWLVGVNAVELSADGKLLYFAAFTGRRLWAVSSDQLASTDVDDSNLAANVKAIGDIGMAGHFALDTSGNLYFMDMEQNAVYRRKPDGSVELVVVDPRLIWPDTLAIGADKYLYITTSQHDLRAEFHHGKDLRQKPYGIFRTFIGSGPVHAMER
jgi:sugar lactone lactonase YvrE